MPPKPKKGVGALVRATLWHQSKKIAAATIRLFTELFKGCGRLAIQIFEAPLGFFALLLAITIILISGAAWMKAGHDVEVGAHITDEFVGGVIGILNKLGGGLSKAVGWIGGIFHHHISIPSIPVPGQLAAYGDLKTICQHFHVTANVALYVPQLIFNEHICPVQRYTYNTALWPVTGVLLGWGYVDARPPPHGDNCAITERDTFCFVANGWRAYLLLVPILIFGYLFAPFSKALGAAIDLCYDLLMTVVEILIDILRRFLFPCRVILPTVNYSKLTKKTSDILSTGL
jgi:hypothetical protein